MAVSTPGRGRFAVVGEAIVAVDLINTVAAPGSVAEDLLPADPDAAAWWRTQQGRVPEGDLPDLRALHAGADIGETFAVRVRASPSLPPWPPSRVTVLGDAIHAMSPARGSGANTALQDAALLCRTLTSATGDRADGNRADGNRADGNRADGSGAASGRADLIAAIGAYEQQMREYGYAAVAASRQAEAETGARRNRPLFWLYRRLAGRATTARSGSGRTGNTV